MDGKRDRREAQEYNRIKKAAWKQKSVENNLMYERQERIHARNQEGSSSSSSHELHSRGIREDVNDVYSDPLYRVGDYYDVWVSGDTTPGVHSTMQGHCACRTPTSLCDCLLH